MILRELGRREIPKNSNFWTKWKVILSWRKKLISNSHKVFIFKKIYNAKVDSIIINAANEKSEKMKINLIKKSIREEKDKVIYKNKVKLK